MAGDEDRPSGLRLVHAVYSAVHPAGISRLEENRGSQPACAVAGHHLCDADGRHRGEYPPVLHDAVLVTADRGAAWPGRGDYSGRGEGGGVG